MYTVDVVAVWVWLAIVYKEITQSRIFSSLSQGHQQSQAVFGQSQIVSLVSALSTAMCP